MLNLLGKSLVGRHDLTRQLGRYRVTVGWVYRSLFRFSRRLTLLAVGANVAGVTMQGAALALLLYYANLMEENRTLAVKALAIEVASRDQSTFLVAMVAVGLILLASAGLIFLGNMKTIRLAVAFAGHCSRRTMALESARPPMDQAPSGAAYPKKIPGRATGLVGIARGVRPLLRVVNPLMLFIYSLAVLFYIDWLLTLIVAVIIAPSMLLHYKVNYLAAQNQKRLGRARERAHKAIVGLLDDLAFAPRLHASEAARLQSAYHDDRIDELNRRYSFRIAAQPYSQVVSDVVIAVVAVGITARLGSLALSGLLSWSSFLGFLVFARIALVSLRGVLSAITGFARHYPRIRQTYELLASEAERAPFDARTLSLVPRGDDAIGDLASAQLRRGRPAAVVTPIPVTRFNLYAFVDGLAGRRSRQNRALRASTACCPDALNSTPGGSIAELLDLAADADGDGALARLRQADPGARLPVNDVHAPLDRRGWRRIPEGVRAQILLAQAAAAPADLLVIDSAVLHAAAAPVRAAWQEQVRERFLAVRYGDPQGATAFGERLVVALAEDRWTSLMSPSWAGRNADAVRSWLSAHSVETAHEAEADDDMDE